MLTRRASENTARAVAAMLTASSSIAAVFPASAQQMANAPVEPLPKLEEVWIAAKARCAARADAGDAWAKTNPLQCALDEKTRIGTAIAKRAEEEASRVTKRRVDAENTKACVERVLAVAQSDPAAYAKAIDAAGLAGQNIDEKNVCKIDQKLPQRRADATGVPAADKGSSAGSRPEVR